MDQWRINYDPQYRGLRSFRTPGQYYYFVRTRDVWFMMSPLPSQCCCASLTELTLTILLSTSCVLERINP